MITFGYLNYLKFWEDADMLQGKAKKIHRKFCSNVMLWSVIVMYCGKSPINVFVKGNTTLQRLDV